MDVLVTVTVAPGTPAGLADGVGCGEVKVFGEMQAARVNSTVTEIKIKNTLL